MQITAKRRDLLDMLGKVKHGVPSRATMPTLGTMLLKAKGKDLTGITTDLETMLFGTCKAQVKKGGTVCVSPRELEAFLKATKVESVTLSDVRKRTRYTVPTTGHTDEETGVYTPGEPEEKTVTEVKLKAQAGAASATFGTFRPEDFPLVPRIKGKAFTIRELSLIHI